MELTAALMIVDVQNDFCPGGALAVADGHAVVPVINQYAARFAAEGLPIFASRDWHPPESKHFRDFGGVWPLHCLQNTAGAQFHPELVLPPATVVVTKGADPNEDAYSAFQAADESGQRLPELLRLAGVNRLYVGGLATDYCVRTTVLDALGQGLACYFLVDASRGVDVQPGDSERAITAMVDAGAEVTTLGRLVL